MADRSWTMARRVTEHLLDETGLALEAGEFARFAKCFHLPLVIQTFDDQRRVDTPDTLRALFETVRAHYRKTGVTSMDRQVIDAASRDADTIEATHETRLLNGTTLIQRPYPVFAVMKRFEDGWKVVLNQYAIADAPSHSAALVGEAHHLSPANQPKDDRYE